MTEGIADLGEHAKEMGRVVGTLVIDGAFLLAVAALNWAASWGVSRFHLEGVDHTVFVCLQWILGVSTIGLVLLRVVADFIVATRRMLKASTEK